MHSKWAGKEENEGTERVKRENNKEQRPSRVGVSLRKMVNNVRKEKQPRGSIFPKGGGGGTAGNLSPEKTFKC